MLDDVQERFWAKVRKTAGCWLWEAGCFPSGYGSVTIERKAHRAHRVSWVWRFGPIPDSLFVLHRCDAAYAPEDKTYRRCVNPDHLYLGTHQDNMDDRARTHREARGDRHWTHQQPDRLVRGSAHKRAKLTEDQVRAIREEYIPYKIGFSRLARKYGVSKRAVACIISGNTWAHIVRG